MGLVKTFLKVHFRFFYDLELNYFFLLLQVKNTEETNQATRADMDKTPRYLEMQGCNTQNIITKSYFLMESAT